MTTHQTNQESQTPAEVKLAAISGIVTNTELHRITDAYKNASPEVKVAYYEGLFTSLWCIIKNTK